MCMSKDLIYIHVFSQRLTPDFFLSPSLSSGEGQTDLSPFPAQVIEVNTVHLMLALKTGHTQGRILLLGLLPLYFSGPVIIKLNKSK